MNPTRRPAIVLSSARKTSRLVSAKSEGATRVSHETPCGILTICGACPILDLDYRKQLIHKRDELKNLLRSAGGNIAAAQVHECVESLDRFGYRHTAKLVVSEKPKADGKRWISIGLYKPGSHDVVDIGNCPVQSALVNNITRYLRGAIRDFEVSVFTSGGRRSGPTGAGLIRYVVIRTSHSNREALVTFVVATKDWGKLRLLAHGLRETFSEVKGVTAHLNAQSGNAIFQFDADPETTGGEDLLAGEAYLEENMSGLKMRFSATSFMQVNPSVAERLYNRIAEWADLQKTETAVDLYSGVGSIALFLAQQGGKVIGIEEIASAVSDARTNASQNKITQAKFYEGRAEVVLPQLVADGTIKSCAIVTLNPSRRGCQKEVLSAAVSLNPRAIIYMSCFPDTLVRDLKTLEELGYVPKFLEPHDMFPGTHHYEVLAYLTRI